MNLDKFEETIPPWEGDVVFKAESIRALLAYTKELKEKNTVLEGTVMGLKWEVKEILKSHDEEQARAEKAEALADRLGETLESVIGLVNALDVGFKFGPQALDEWRESKK